MKLEKSKNYMDEKVWRCRTKQIIHDEKINIRKNSVFEDINISLPISYFLLFYCFIEKYSLDKSFIEVNNNKYLFGSKTCSKVAIGKFYSLIREKIKRNTHKLWRNNKMEHNISSEGYPVFKIDESEIIGNNETINWMFSIIDRISKESRVFCVLNDRTINNLMPII